MNKKKVFLAALILSGNLGIFAQSLTLRLSHVTVSKAMTELRKQSGYSFVFEGGDVDTRRRVTVDAKSVRQAADQILASQDVSYTIQGKSIIVTGRRAQASESPQRTERRETGTRTIRGRVTDENGEPVIGASVRDSQNLSNGTVTDVDGNYKINLNDDSNIIVSYIGFDSQTLHIDGSSNLNVRLRETQKDLNEIVVIGYGTQRKSDLTGSVVSISEGKFSEGVNTNAFQMINGKAAGVNVSQVSSEPGASTKIQIRGAGSINSSNAALVVVDGLPGVDPSSLNPNDVKSIEILKDASAAAIYGTRAANGVVLITTKNGNTNQPLRVTFAAEVALQSVAKKIDMLNAKEYMQTLNTLRAEAKNPEGPIFTQEQIEAAGNGTDWQDEIFRSDAPVQTYRVGFSGGGTKHNFYVGLSVMDHKGLVKKTDLTKYNVRANFNANPTNFLRIKFNINYTRNDGNSIYIGNGVNENAGVINSAIQFDPTMPTGIDPTTGRYYANPYISLDNPLALLNGIDQDKHSNNLYGTLALELEPMKDLVLTGRIGADLNSYMNNFYRSRITKLGQANGGVAEKNSGEDTQWLAEFMLNYKHTFAQVHNFSAMVGTTFEQFKQDYITGDATGFLSDVLKYNNMHSGDNDNGDDVYSSNSRNRLNGFLGRINYSFLDRYLLTASFRYDGSSRFSNDNKYAFFPSVAAAWRISEEPWMKNINVLNQLKLRLGYGQLGNQGIDNYATRQTLVAGGSAVFGDKLEQGVVAARLPNRNLKWETTEEYNIGFDFGFLKNRISGSIDYYVRNTRDQLFNKPLPSSIGFSNIMVNAGKVRNSGIDLVLNSVNIDNKDLQWETALNVSYLKNKVISLPDYIPQLITGSMASFVSDFNITRVGDPIYSFYGYKVDGIFQQDDDVAKSGQPNAKPGDLKFHDESGDGKITSDDRTVLGKPFPDVTFGLTNTLRWKGFTLSVFLQGVFGISMLDINVMESFYPTNEYRNRIAKYYRHRWTADNPSNEYPSGVNPTDYGGQFSVNSKTVVDASFLRVKNISLSYDIPLRSHRIFQGLQAYAAIDNLATFTSYDGYDPDASATGANAVSKVAYNSYPLARTVRLGVNLTF